MQRLGFVEKIPLDTKYQGTLKLFNFTQKAVETYEKIKRQEN